MKKIYIALDSFAFDTATVIAMTENSELLAYTYSPCFGSGAIPAFRETAHDEEYLEKYKAVYGHDYELVFIKDFNYPREYSEIISKYKENNK